MPYIAITVGSGTRNVATDQVTRDGVTEDIQVVTFSGVQTAPVAAGTSLIVKGSAGRVSQVLVTASGTAGLPIYDNASAATGTIIAFVPPNASPGTVVLGLRAALGIFVPATTGGPAVTVEFS